MYLDVEILVNFHHLAKHEYVLHYARKLPHVSYSLEQRHLFGWLRRLHLIPAAFSGWHMEGRPGRLPGRFRRVWERHWSIPIGFAK
jgi:hypothetical protein